MKLTDLPRVLVLDDDAELRGLLIRVLQRDGFAVTAVDTIAAFDHALAQGGADVCVLDWALRGEDGWVLARRRSSSVIISNTRTTLLTPPTPRAISVARVASRGVTSPIR